MDDTRLSYVNPVLTGLTRSEITVESVYNSSKIETLQWQLRQISKSRDMYKSAMKQIAIFLEKAHVSMDHLGKRLHRKNPVPESKSEHHIPCDISSHHDRASMDARLSEWNAIHRPCKEEDHHPDELPPEKLSQEAYRLLRTVQSLLSTQEPNLSSTESVTSSSDELSDIEFLAQLAKEFPRGDPIPPKTTSFSVNPKLILPERDIKISAAFTRKLSLQMNQCRSFKTKYFKTNALSRISVAENDDESIVAEKDSYSLPPEVDTFDRNAEIELLRSSARKLLESSNKTMERKSRSPTTSIASSTEDDSGCSSMISNKDIGPPMVNSTMIDNVSSRTALLRSMLHCNSGHVSLSNDYEENNSPLDETLTPLSKPEENNANLNENIRDSESRNEDSKQKLCERNCQNASVTQMNAVVHQPPQFLVNAPMHQTRNALFTSGFYSLPRHGNHQRRHSTPDQKVSNKSLVSWV